MKMCRIGTVTLAFVGVALAWAPSASAATVSHESEHRDLGYIGGRHYANYAIITASDTHVRGSADIHANPGVSVPTGDIGASVVIMQNGAVCAQSDYVFNDRPVNDLKVYFDLDPSCGPGTYTAKGVTEIWNGSAYSERLTFTTDAVYFDH